MKISTLTLTALLAVTGSLAFAAGPNPKTNAKATPPECIYAGEPFTEGAVIRIAEDKFIKCAPKSSMVYDEGKTALVWKMADSEDVQPKQRK